MCKLSGYRDGITADTCVYNGILLTGRGIMGVLDERDGYIGFMGLWVKRL